MHFEGENGNMTSEDLEKIIIKELIALCLNCRHAETCSYRKNAAKAIIQCELYELEGNAEKINASDERPKGLCATCHGTTSCCLPEKESGTWHCEKYK
jgi:hypothetical protein